MKTKSIIKSKAVKKAIREAVKAAVIECAYQHEANGKPHEGYDSLNLNEKGLPTSMGMLAPSKEALDFANSQPVQVKLTVSFTWPEITPGVKPVEMFCQPIIDLTTLS
jgi:hypothetical protein